MVKLGDGFWQSFTNTTDVMMFVDPRVWHRDVMGSPIDG
jgi:hypothetical protein